MEVIRGGQGDFGQEICGEAEREQLEAMICAGKHPAQSLTKVRILLKADVSEAGEGWSDSAISAALDTSINNIGCTRRRWVIPPDANAGFVAAMEDVLETYQKPRDPDRPLVCLDETSKQLIVET